MAKSGWRSLTGALRAVKVVYRDTFENERTFNREFAGMSAFEPISRAHDGFVDILHVGRGDGGAFFNYVMELADIIFVNGAPKLADIGLVAASGQQSFVGTEGYVPPEGPGTAQADI